MQLKLGVSSSHITSDLVQIPSVGVERKNVIIDGDGHKRRENHDRKCSCVALCHKRLGKRSRDNRKSIENDPLARVEIGPIWIATEQGSQVKLQKTLTLSGCLTETQSHRI